MRKYILAPVILITANIFFTGSFSLVKYLSINVPVYVIMLFRFLAGPVFLGPYFFCLQKPLQVKNWPLFILRIGFGVSAMTCLFFAFKYTELAKSLLIFELSVIWTLIYGWIRYRNKPHFLSLIAIPVAFIGVFFVLQPTGLLDFQKGDFFAFLGSILNAGVYVTLKKLRTDHDTSTVVFVTYCLSSAILLIPFLLNAVSLSLDMLLGLTIMASIGFVGQLAMTAGFKFASAGISSLFMLSIIPFTAISGAVFFDETLNLLASTGIVLVLGSLVIIGKYR